MIRALVRGALVALLLSCPAAAQDRAQTLADIRQELSVLFVEIQRLRGELNTSAAPQGIAGGSVLDRVTAIEERLQDLTAQTERLSFRIDEIVRDGTNRLGDLEFRLVELEGGDIGALGETTTLGGAAPPPVAAAPDTTGLTVTESDDYEAAVALLDAGRTAEAADAFTTFAQTYPGGPLTVDAQFLAGEAHAELGEMRSAARAYLDAFTANPEGARAPDALLKLGTSLAALGQVSEACVTLGEVSARYPASEAASLAEAARRQNACG
ncbi:MAG: tol-pal system protein YbgF [Shimia sp.]